MLLASLLLLAAARNADTLGEAPAVVSGPCGDLHERSLQVKGDGAETSRVPQDFLESPKQS